MIAFHTAATPKGHTVSVALDELGLSSRTQLLGSAPECLEACGVIR